MVFGMEFSKNRSAYKIKIGKSNTSTPEILKMLNIEDHLLPCEGKVLKRKYSHLNLEFAIWKINRKFDEMLSTMAKMEGLEEGEVVGMEYSMNKEKVLRRLMIHGLHVRMVHTNLKKLTKQVYLCKQFLVELSSEVRYFKEMDVFQACCNYLVTIPREIGFLANLKVLVLSRNRISRLPEEIGMLKELRELNLSQNRLRSLPKSITSLKSLSISSWTKTNSKDYHNFSGN
ncbi:leucine-rich repeat-containing protein 1-like [Nylanderia fulva]|uniref:leucine-rich repeat-containing protein 1-like n=1 Tax=Nylanderia fulva TaxID=613905 RepID=UPI0010FAD647|nr:leucine-rich repeat-containing protein 1-like [Nylanderia fulva]